MLIINLIGLSLIGLIVWWFWLYKPKTQVLSDSNESADIIITVADGVYQPASLTIPAGKAITLKFERKDASPCAATVQFPDLEISEELPLNKQIAINLPALAAGKYAFHCQMQMYKGELIVK
jgi:plastocyanin domain-containing protein